MPGELGKPAAAHRAGATKGGLPCAPTCSAAGRGLLAGPAGAAGADACASGAFLHTKEPPSKAGLLGCRRGELSSSAGRPARSAASASAMRAGTDASCCTSLLPACMSSSWTATCSSVRRPSIASTAAATDAAEPGRLAGEAGADEAAPAASLRVLLPPSCAAALGSGSAASRAAAICSPRCRQSWRRLPSWRASC